MSKQRDPILSYKEAASWLDPGDRDGGSELHWICKVRDFYENLITKGELRVVKTTRNGACNDWACDHCDRRIGGEPEFNYCPGCGAEIVNP